MNISERDIFNFIFFDRLLSEQKRVFINDNITDFEQIEYYKRLKWKSDSNIDRKTKQIIASKIQAYEMPRLINLFPVTNELIEKSLQKTNSIAVKIKADIEMNPNTETFIDNDNQFVVRFVKTNGFTVIHLFSVQKNMITEIKLILQPGNRHFLLNDLNEPIKVNNLQIVESITLELI